MCKTEYDPLDKSNSLFQGGVNIVAIWSLNVFRCVITLTLANAILLLGSSTLILVAKVTLNL